MDKGDGSTGDSARFALSLDQACYYWYVREDSGIYTHELVALLSVASDNLQPSEIAAEFSVPPTKSSARGQQIASDTHPWPRSNRCVWEIKRRCPVGDLTTIDELLAIVSANRDTLLELKSVTQQSFCIVIYTEECNSGVLLSPAHMQLLCECDISLDVEVYILPGDDAE